MYLALINHHDLIMKMQFPYHSGYIFVIEELRYINYIEGGGGFRGICVGERKNIFVSFKIFGGNYYTLLTNSVCG